MYTKIRKTEYITIICNRIYTDCVYTITYSNLCNSYIRNDMLLVGLEHDMNRKYSKNVNSIYVFL